MAVANVKKRENEIEKVTDDLENLTLDEKSLEKDLQHIAKGLEEIFNSWELTMKDSGVILKEILFFYKNSMWKKGKGLDFCQRSYQWCYMFIFMLHHSYLLFRAIENAVGKNAIKIDPSGNPINVCVIGGGPGSDILGLCLLLHKNNGAKPWLNNVSVLDKYEEWKYSWQKIEDCLPDNLKRGMRRVDYFKFDFGENDLSNESKERVKAAHVVTLVKSLSSAEQTVDEKADGNSVYSILDNMKDGALLFFLDNRDGQQCKILEEANKKLKYKLLHKYTLPEFNGPKCYEGYSKEFRDKIKFRLARNSSGETFIILQKPGAISDQPKLAAN